MTMGGWHARGFRALMRLYPGWFRREHGAEMEHVFLVRLARVRGRGVLRLWGVVVRDAVETAIALRRRRVGRQAPRPGPKGRWQMFWQDLRYGIRHLARTPVFAIGAVAILAVGIGANIAVFAVADPLLFRPPPFDRPDEVVYVYQDSDDGEPSSCSFPAYRDMTAYDVFSAVTAISPDQVRWTRADGEVDAAVEFTTASYLDVAGLAVSRGRWFSPEDDRVGGEPVAVVSEPTWRAHLNADPAVVGRTVRLNGRPVTIIGVGPAGLSGSADPVVTDFWLSISSTVLAGQFRVDNLERREDHWYTVRARLAPGTTPDAARSAMESLATRLADEYPALNRGRDITIRPARDVQLFGHSGLAIYPALALVALLLLLACANLANLQLVRGIDRSGEMAVRRAMGAGAIRIARLHLVEAVILSAVGGSCGLLLAQWALAALPSAPLPAPFSSTLDLAIDARVAIFAAATMLATAILFGFAPTLRSMRTDVAGALRDDRRTVSLGRGTMRLRSGLVVVQVAGSLVLMLAAGLLARSLAAMQGVDPGVDADRVAYVRATLGDPGPPSAATLDAMLDRVLALPGVTGVAATSRLPAQFAGTTTTIVEDYTPPAGTDAVELGFTIVTPEYFATVGLDLVDGRGFAPGDVAGADRVVILPQATARRFWGQAPALGRRLRSQSNPDVVRTVVGVVEDAPVDTFPDTTSAPMFYAPASQARLGAAYIVARVDGEASSHPASMRRAVTDVLPSSDITSTGTLASHFGSALSGQRFMARAAAVVSVLAGLLAALGIYAVVAFNVARRASELGLRVALGARPGRVVRLVVRETLRAVVLGLLVGIGVAAWVAPRVDALLFGIDPLDPLAFSGAIGLLLVVGCLAAWLPARRAAQADPASVLRSG